MNKIYDVAELNREIRSILEGRYPFVAVSGEISSLRKPYSGHLYFTLKDTDAQIKAVLFKLQQRYLSEIPKDGQQVICRGRVSVYEPRGDYQLIVDTIDFHGQGNLHIEFEKLKVKLAGEGLFSSENKKQLPVIPGHITLVTSPNGAAVHDFIKIATRRYPPIQLLVYPVSVQGTHAAMEMIDALAHINHNQATDLIVLCRGGGSLEDLWAYNDEQLAQAIYQSEIPIVSAVGHEIDFTIADLVADKRAPTPSGAAEIVVPDKKALIERLSSLQVSLVRALEKTILEKEKPLQRVRQILGHTPQPIDSLLLTIDNFAMRLKYSISDIVEQGNSTLGRLQHTLEQRNPVATLLIQQQQLRDISRRFFLCSDNMIQQKEQKLQRTANILDAVSPLATMARGYSITRKRNMEQTVIRKTDQVMEGEQINILIQDGDLACTVDRINKQNST